MNYISKLVDGSHLLDGESGGPPQTLGLQCEKGIRQVDLCTQQNHTEDKEDPVLLQAAGGSTVQVVPDNDHVSCFAITMPGDDSTIGISSEELTNVDDYVVPIGGLLPDLADFEKQKKTMPIKFHYLCFNQLDGGLQRKEKVLEANFRQPVIARQGQLGHCQHDVKKQCEPELS